MRRRRERVRRTNSQLFLDKLAELSGDRQVPVGNRALRESLGWDDNRYRRTRADLLGRNRITKGPGQGGTVTLSKSPKAKSHKKGPRVRRAYSQLFIDKLVELCEGQQKLISNKTLREELKWDESRYDQIRSELVDQGKLIVGRGQGGTVGLAAVPGAKALSVFVSYSHADETLKTELDKHLRPLQRLQLIDAWHDRKIAPGDEWDKSISENLEKADIILLLVSIDFINSPYCYDIELERAIERHSAKQAVVIPIILRSCMWQQTSFAKLQALPKDAKAISLWENLDDALVNVAEGVRQVASDILSRR
jgi:hypothetical protein